MKCNISVLLSSSPEALLRLLSLIQRRGFSPLYVEAKSDSDQKMKVNLCLRSERDNENLCHQIKKLVDVEQVEVV